MSVPELPLVSIIVPLYKHEAYIGQCLDSIVADSYPCKELVIIDDGSPDGSADVVRRWQEQNAGKLSGGVTFISRENRGISRTLNELIGLARGEYLALVASDDFLLPDSIAVRVEYLKAHPQKKVVLCDYIVVDTSGALLYQSGVEDYYHGDKRCLANDDLIAYELISRWSFAGAVFLYRKEVFALLGGYDEQLIVEDWDMCLKFASRGLLGFVDYPGAAYRIHGDNVVSRPGMTRKMLENQLETAYRHLHSFAGLKRHLLRAYINQAKLDLIRQEHRGGDLWYRLARIVYKFPRWRYRCLVEATFRQS